MSRTPATTNLSRLAPFCSHQINAVDLRHGTLLPSIWGVPGCAFGDGEFTESFGRHGDLRDDQLLKAWRFFPSQEGEMKDDSGLNDTNEYQVYISIQGELCCWKTL